MSPMAEDFKPTSTHVMIAVEAKKPISWVYEEIDKCRAWATKKGVLRTPRGWQSTVSRWLKTALVYEQQQAKGRDAYGVRHSGNGAHGSGNSDQNDVVSLKLAAYRRFQSSNPKLAAEYLEEQCERVSRAILGAG